MYGRKSQGSSDLPQIPEHILSAWLARDGGRSDPAVLSNHLSGCETIPSLPLQIQIRYMKRMPRKYQSEKGRGLSLIFSFLERVW